MPKEHDYMKLPEGKTCAHCAHFSKCNKLVGAQGNWTSCDYHPRRYLLNAREIALSALLKAEKTINSLGERLHGEIVWKTISTNSPELAQINEAIKDLRP